MERSGRHRNQLPSNLPQLQNLIKRDPHAYKEEFIQQHHHYQSLLQLLFLSPSEEIPQLSEIVMFLSQIACCYPNEMAEFPSELERLLREHSTTLHPDVRMTMCRAMILLRNKGVVEPNIILELFFELFRCQDKALRTVLYSHIVSDLKRINSKHKNNKVNGMLQSFMYRMLRDDHPVAAKMSLAVMIELYRKNIWRDTKTVNILTTACFSPVTKIMTTTLRFFLTGDDAVHESESESSDESGTESQALRDMVLSRQTVKSGRKRERKVARARAVLKKQKKKKKIAPEARFSALHLIHDPQDFVEKLFKRLEKANEKFDIKLMMMGLIARLIGVHQLFLFNFYPFLQRYLQPHQREVTKILTYLAQASHNLVPPEILEPSVRTVVNNFVTERNTNDAIAMGLNTLREVCTRCPLVMTKDLLHDLASYKSFKDKGVMMAARSLIQLFRNVRPEFLQKKDRGRPTEAGPLRAREYGELVAVDDIPETEFLTDEEFRQLRLKQMCAHLQPMKGEAGEAQLLAMEEEESGQGELLSEAAITTIQSKLKRTREERISTMKSGQEKKQYGHKRAKLNPHSSTTNQQKNKKKAFLMIKQKRAVRTKGKRSFRERQISLRNSLIKQRKK